MSNTTSFAPEFFETYNANGEYTGKYRCAVLAPHYKAEILHFDLPGKGGKVTREAAAKIAQIMAGGGSIEDVFAKTEATLRA